MIWADLVTPDLAAAERFYGGLFGWTFRSIHAGKTEYAVASIGGRPVGGLLQRPVPAGEHRQSAWLTFLAVRNVDAVRRTAMRCKPLHWKLCALGLALLVSVGTCTVTGGSLAKSSRMISSSKTS